MSDEMKQVTAEDWLKFGILNGWCTEPYCDVHDPIPMTDEESVAYENGEEMCWTVVRLPMKTEHQENG